MKDMFEKQEEISRKNQVDKPLPPTGLEAKKEIDLPGLLFPKPQLTIMEKIGETESASGTDGGSLARFDKKSMRKKGAKGFKTKSKYVVASVHAETGEYGATTERTDNDLSS